MSKKAAAKKKASAKRLPYKSVDLPEMTIEQALIDAFAEIEVLKDEMQEICDNMSGMEHLPKFEVAEAAVSELESHCEAPDVPKVLKTKTISTLTEMRSTRKGRAASRAVRLHNATGIIAAVIELCDEVDLDDDVSKAEREAVCELRDALEEHENIEVEFPRMYG